MGRRDEVAHTFAGCGRGPLASPEPFPLPLLVQRGSHVRVEPGWGHAWVGGLLPFSTGQKVRSKRASWTSPSVQNRKHLKLRKTHILSVCQTLYVCLSFNGKGQERSIDIAISFRSYPKIETGQDTVTSPGKGSRPVTVSISNALVRKWLVIPLMVLCNFWFFILFPFLFIVANFDPT